MARDTTATDRLGLDRPELLADWASSWDELVELIDEDLVQSGTTSERPSSGDHDEELYLDYEAQVIYRWDESASSWETAIDGSTGYTDSDAISAINSDSDHGSTASHNYYTSADAIAAIEAESPLELTGPVNIGNPSTGAITYPFAVEAGTAGDENIAIAIQGDGSATNHGNLNWYHSNGNLVGTVSGDGGGSAMSIYVADVEDVSTTSGSQQKAVDFHCGAGHSDVDFPNTGQMRIWEQTDTNPVWLDLHGSPGESAMLRFFHGTGGSPGTGTLSFALSGSGASDLSLYDYEASQYLFEYVGNGLRIPEGVEDANGDVMMDGVAAQGTVTLSSGSATVSTGITTTGTHLDVHLDPSGGGANTADVGVSARAVWNNTAGEYEVEILEDGTSVGNPTIGYKVVTS